MTGAPAVKVIDAIKPANIGTGDAVLRYDALTDDVATYDQTSSLRAAEFWDSEPDSVEEAAAARQYALELLLKTSVKVVESTPENHDLWADRFTQASIETYGQPDAGEAARLMADDYKLWEDLKGSKDFSQAHLDFLLRTYEPILLDHPEASMPDPNREAEKRAIKAYGSAILDQYQYLFDAVDNTKKKTFKPQELRQLFENGFSELFLQNRDMDWGEWRAILVPGTSISVDRFDRRIKIGENREPASKQDARGLVAHEVLVHALRCKNGYSLNDRHLATGLNGYLDGEEGLGILAEEGVNGELPPRAACRYSDIGLALGSMDGVQRSREDMFQLATIREVVRQQYKGEFDSSKIDSLNNTMWTYVDRIYRGGRGESLGERQAIFTKDISYYKGYRQMAAYITRQMAAGRTARQVFDYLSLGKFDPEHPQHVDHLNAVLAQTRR